MSDQRIPRFVLTGGPCAGKSTALAMLSQKLTDYGVMPFMVPEAATQIIMSGVRFKDISDFNEFQKEIIRFQIIQEDAIERFARLQIGGRKVLICDRGAMDGMAYVDPELFEAIVHDMSYQLINLREERYDGVFHLKTAADGAEAFYNNLNNPARHETPEEARAQDTKTLAAWFGHDHLRIIGNYSKDVKKCKQPIDFQTKMENLLKEFCHVLGLPTPLEIEKKFLLPLDTDTTLLKFPSTPVVIDIRQTYLKPSAPGIERRVRERRQKGGALYTYTEKQEVRPGVRAEKERVIGAREYIELRKQRLPKCHDIVKRRYAFAADDRYYQLDMVSSPQPIALLEIKLTEENDDFVLPPGFVALKEVTNEPFYKNLGIAYGLCPGYR